MLFAGCLFRLVRAIQREMSPLISFRAQGKITKLICRIQLAEGLSVGGWAVSSKGLPAFPTVMSGVNMCYRPAPTDRPFGRGETPTSPLDFGLMQWGYRIAECRTVTGSVAANHLACPLPQSFRGCRHLLPGKCQHTNEKSQLSLASMNSMERTTGLEPATPTLARLCSTN